MLLKYELIEIESVNFEDDNFEDVYDLEVEENHSYTANEYIVHNCDTRIKTGVGVPQLSAVIECFEPNSKVKTKGGDKRIADVKIGDYALTHKGRYKKITRIFKKNINEKLLKVNDNISTDNHEYYVIEKKYINYITDENIHDYAKWVEAKNLNSDFLLVKHARS